MVKVSEKHSPNSVEFGRTCSNNKQIRVVGGYFDRLPCEILHNIVLMLPFASIIQLRRSSKFLYNCLTHAKFVDLQLTHALQKSSGCLFTVHNKYGSKCEMYTLEQSGGDLTISQILKYSKDGYGRFQSSGGLICVYSRESKSFRIFNPHIGQEVEVLDVPIVKDCSNFKWWGFSYSPSTKDYKILKIGVLRSEKETGALVLERNVAAITTLGSNIWREIQNVPSYLSFDLFTECQGKLFWETKPGFISLFDIVSEKFHEIPGPPRGPFRPRARVMFGPKRLRDKLISMGHTIGYVHNYKLWVLEDQTKGIWINKYDFSTHSMHMYARGLTGISGNGGLFGLMENSTSVFSQDMSSTDFSPIQIKLDDYIGKVGSEMISFVAPHVRSLVSPVRIMEMGSKVTKGSGQQIYDHSDHMDINLKRKWVLETLKLDYNASEDDLFNNVYKLMRGYDDHPKQLSTGDDQTGM